MNDSSNICLACGLCCDGTLIGFVELASDEMPRLKKIMEIEEIDGNGFFLHPCKKFCDGCTIYEDRPKQCDLFKCGLLNSVEQKELDFNVALTIIEEVKQKKVTIQKLIAVLELPLKSESFYFKIIELKKVLQKIKQETALTQNHLNLESELQQLEELMMKKFDLTLN